MKPMNKVFSLILVAMLVGSLLAGCGSGKQTDADNTKSPASEAGQSEARKEENETEKGAGEAKELYFYHWTKEENVAKLQEQFDLDYAGTYSLVYEKMADAETMTINTALSSGETIDVMCQANALDLRNRADSGVYLGLKQFFDQEGWDYADVFGEASEEVMNIDGDYYGIPYGTNVLMVWYNKAMFDEAGLAYPEEGWTWDDFHQAALALTSGDGQGKVYGAMVDLSKYWNVIARQELGSNAFYSEDLTETRFDDPAYKTSLDYWYQLAMVDQCIVPVEEYTALKYNSESTGIAGMYSGKYAMYLCPNYGALYLTEAYGEVPEGVEIGLVDIPSLEGGKNVTIVYSSTASIPANCEDPQAAWELLKYFCIEQNFLFNGAKANLPGYLLKTEEEKELFYGAMLQDKPGLDYDEAYEIMSSPREYVTRDCTIKQGQTEINDLCTDTMSLVFVGEFSVDEALALLKEEGDAAIAAAK